MESQIKKMWARQSQTIVMIKFTFSHDSLCLFLWWAADGFRTRIFFFLLSFIKKRNELQTEIFTSSFVQITANKLGAASWRISFEELSKYLNKTMKICIIFNLNFIQWHILCCCYHYHHHYAFHSLPSQKSLTCILI